MWLAMVYAAALTVAPIPEGRCQSVPQGRVVSNASGQPIFVRTVGIGRPLLVIPSLARGARDFDKLATMLAKEGVETVLPDPRATGQSTGVPAKDLFDLAGDDLRVIEALCTGRVDVLGHAFGNRVARALATEAPDRVSSVILLAGGGEVRPTPRTTEAVQGALSEGIKPDAERLEDLRLAFFARGQDASVWLKGWYPDAAKLERAASLATPVAKWWKAGGAPVLLIQASEDPVAPSENAAALKRDLGKRLSLVELPHASHAILPEQPQAVAAVIDAYLKGTRDAAQLQRIVSKTDAAP
jgi:pimeloyl-ACP methyl ester carboxylesterase